MALVWLGDHMMTRKDPSVPLSLSSRRQLAFSNGFQSLALCGSFFPNLVNKKSDFRRYCS